MNPVIDETETGTKVDPAGIRERIAARRERHRGRSLPARVGAVVGGALLGLVGLVLVVPLPELGTPALLGGLGLLALEFEWAARAQVRAELLLERARRRFHKLPRPTRWMIFAAAVAVLLLLVWLAL